MRRPARRPASPGPFRAGKHAFEDEAWIRGPERFVMTGFPRLEGAERLVAILNEAKALADDWDMLNRNALDGRMRIAHAVAFALGGRIDFDSFREKVDV